MYRIHSRCDSRVHTVVISIRVSGCVVDVIVRYTCVIILTCMSGYIVDMTVRYTCVIISICMSGCVVDVIVRYTCVVISMCMSGCIVGVIVRYTCVTISLCMSGCIVDMIVRYTCVVISICMSGCVVDVIVGCMCVIISTCMSGYIVDMTVRYTCVITSMCMSGCIVDVIVRYTCVIVSICMTGCMVDMIVGYTCVIISTCMSGYMVDTVVRFILRSCHIYVRVHGRYGSQMHVFMVSSYVCLYYSILLMFMRASFHPYCYTYLIGGTCHTERGTAIRVTTGVVGGATASVRMSVTTPSVVQHRSGRSVDIPTPAELRVLPPRAATKQQEKRLQDQLNLRVKRDTLNTHVRWWAQWKEYANSQHHDLYLRSSTDLERVKVLAIFFCHLLDHGRMLYHVNEIFKAMKFFFLQELNDVEFFSHDLIVRLKDSAKPVGRLAFTDHQSRRKEPVTFDLVKWIRDNCRMTIEGRLTYVGIAMAFNFMLRASEIIFIKPDQDEADEVHAITYEDVSVLTVDNKWNPLSVNTSLDSTRILGFRFVVTTSKTDRSGSGRRLTLKRDGPNQSQLIDDIASFIRESRIRRGDVLMSRWKTVGSSRETNLKLTKEMMSTTLKKAAAAFGLDARQFSCHSLRTGGATQLAASGANSNMIERVGGWTTRNGGRAAGYQRSTLYDHGALGAIDSRNGGRQLSATDISHVG